MQDLKETTSYKKALRGKILEAAMRAFAERGIKAVKMDDVASMLGISKRTLYEIYVDKEELLYQGVKAYDQQEKETMKEIAAKADSVMEIVLEAYRQKVRQSRSVNPQFYEDLRKYPKVGEYLKTEHERTRAQFQAFLKRGVAEGCFRHDVDYELISYLFDTIGTYIMSNHMMARYSLEELFANLLLVPLRGFCTAKGIKALDAAALVGDGVA